MQIRLFYVNASHFETAKSIANKFEKRNSFVLGWYLILKISWIKFLYARNVVLLLIERKMWYRRLLMIGYGIICEIWLIIYLVFLYGLLYHQVQKTPLRKRGIFISIWSTGTHLLLVIGLILRFKFLFLWCSEKISVVSFTYYQFKLVQHITGVSSRR